MNSRLLACLLAVAACASSGGAAAATTCRLGSGAALAFGTYDVLSPTPDDSLATISATCARDGGPQNVTITLQLSAGTNGASVGARRMFTSAGGGAYLSYNLFRDLSRTAVWGYSTGLDTGSITLTVPNKSSRTATFTIYGRIPAQQDVPAGSYADAVIVTISP